LSFGNNNRTFGQRSVKRKKQEFHRHKIKPSETRESPDFVSLKERTMLSLTHLGEQRFAEEPGGYSFENWMNSLNLLLDEFEEQAGSENLPSDYFAKRLELISSLAESKQPSSELDSEIANLREEELKIQNAISALRTKSKAYRESEGMRERLKILESEKNRNLELLERANNNLAQKKKQIQDSSKLLKRLFGAPKPLDQTSLQTFEDRVSDIESKLEGIEKKVSEQKKRIEFAERAILPDQAIDDPNELQSRSDAINMRLQELEAKKFEESQFLEKRKEVTEILRDVISKFEDHRQVASVQPMQ
jgi:chromosome segregation ATPase